LLVYFGKLGLAQLLLAVAEALERLFQLLAALLPTAALVERGKNSFGVYRIPLATMIGDTTL